MDAFDRDAILDALRLLDAELGRQAVRGEIFVVGGAAMALAYDERRATRDVDAVFAPSHEVRLAAARVGEQLGFEPDWLNDAVKAFLPGDDLARRTVYDGDNLGVAVASPKFLLAMKLLSSRADRDLDDIRALYRWCGFTTADEGLDLVAEMYPRARILPRTQFFLEEMFPVGEESLEQGRGQALPREQKDKGPDLHR
jgi:hypothetical protein